MPVVNNTTDFAAAIKAASFRRPAAAVLGTKVEGSTEDALKIAGLMWPVKTFPLYAYMEDENGKDVQPLPEHFCTCRKLDDGWHPIAPVGNRYQVIQNTDVFSIMDTLREQAGGKLTFGGEIGEGRKVYLAMSLPTTVRIGDDDHGINITGWNSHDGSGTAKLCVTVVRAVCMNTLVFGFNHSVSTIAVRHTTSASERMQAAADIIEHTFTYATEFKAEAEKLLATVFTDKQYRQLVDKMTPVPAHPTERQQKAAEEQRDALEELWLAPTQAPIRGTAWGAYNAVAEYIDWLSPAKGDKDKARALRVLNGVADRSKAEAHKRILAMVG